MLGSSDDTVYVHEPDGVHDPYAFRAKLSEHHHPMIDPGHVRPEFTALWDGVFAGGRAAGGLGDTIARRAYARVTREQKMAARLEGARPLLVRASLRYARPRAERNDCRHVVAKSVNAAFCLEWIVERSPKPEVLVVTRNPLNVVASWRDFGWQPPQSTMYDAIRARAQQRWNIELPPPDATALERSAVMAATLGHSLADACARHPEWVVASHEALCIDPLSGFERLAAQLHLPFGDRARAELAATNTDGSGYATKRVSAEQPDSWRRRLAPDEVEVIAAVLDRFGPHQWLEPAQPGT